MFSAELIAGELPANEPTKNGQPNSRPSIPQATSLAPWEKASVGKRVRSGKALYTMGRSLMSACTRLMLDLDMRWHAPMPEGPKILAANHPTTTDPLYLLTLLSEPVSFLITADLFDVPVVGSYLRAAGHLPAVRGSSGATVDTLVRRVEAGRSVAIFPEGALSPLAGGLHPPHSGVGRVALRTGAPVIPIGIGLRRDRIRLTGVELGGDKAIAYFYTTGPYAITVGLPLHFAGDVEDHEQVRAVAGRIMHHVQALAQESGRRIGSTQMAAASALSGPTWARSVAGAPPSGKTLP